MDEKEETRVEEAAKSGVVKADAVRADAAKRLADDKFILGGHEFSSRFILGSGKYSMKLIDAAVKDAGAEIITLAVRRANTKDQENILDYIPKNVTLLPNTSGARNADEAVRIARLARALGCGDFVKAEIMRDTKLVSLFFLKELTF